jgi:ribosomal protein S7
MKKLNKHISLLKYKIYNYLLKHGKKNTCEKLLLNSNKYIQKISNKSHKDLIKLAIINNSPVMQIKQIKRKRKKTKEFPLIINKKIRIFLAVNSILNFSNKKQSINFSNKLKEEILLSAAYKSNSIKTTITIQEQANKLKKYAHYRWIS